jgi:hydroxymethylbilane synthase
VAADRQPGLGIGTRGSALALWQADHVIAQLRAHGVDLPLERVVLSTLGDRVPDRPLSRIGEKGLFTAELEAALRARTIDLAVHSLKDLPTSDPTGLVIGAVLAREDPRDVLLSTHGDRLASLPSGSVVGTSSLRRRAQLLMARPDLRVADLRGNVPTRVEKLRRGDYRALVLARAGLARLGLTAHISEVLEADVVVPAAGQGAVAVQARQDDERVARLLARLDHRPTRLATLAERTVLGALEGGCQVPLGALGVFQDEMLTLCGVVADLEGRRVVRGVRRAPVTQPPEAVALGHALAQHLVEQGAREILDSVRATAALPVDPRS